MPFLEAVFSALFPDRCVGCSERGGLLCNSCQSALPPAPSPKDDFIMSAYSYADPRVRRLVKLLKYKNARHAAEAFGRPLAEMLVEFSGENALFLSERPILLVPVPLSSARRKKRGYNQAELLARAMLPHLRLLGRHVSLETGILRKISDTKSQARTASRAERLSNLGTCFEAATGRRYGGEIVVLIDDVMTTGATLSAARKALLDGGFRHVSALTAAH